MFWTHVPCSMGERSPPDIRWHTESSLRIFDVVFGMRKENSKFYWLPGLPCGLCLHQLLRSIFFSEAIRGACRVGSLISVMHIKYVVGFSFSLL